MTRVVILGVIEAVAKLARDENEAALFRIYMIMCRSMGQKRYTTRSAVLKYAKKHGLVLSKGYLRNTLHKECRWWRVDGQKIYIVSQSHLFDGESDEHPLTDADLVSYRTTAAYITKVLTKPGKQITREDKQKELGICPSTQRTHEKINGTQVEYQAVEVDASLQGKQGVFVQNGHTMRRTASIYHPCSEPIQTRYGCPQRRVRQLGHPCSVVSLRDKHTEEKPFVNPIIQLSLYPPRPRR